MQFDTKIAIMIRLDLEIWQKLNVAAFLASGIARPSADMAGADPPLDRRRARQPEDQAP